MIKIKSSFLGLVILLLTPQLIAQERNKALKMLKQRGEIYVKFDFPKNADLRLLSKEIAIDKVLKGESSNEIFAYLNQKEYKQFAEKAIDFELLTPPSMLLEATMCADLNGVKNWNCYPTYQQYLDLMQAFVSDFPDLCQLVEFGQSVDGRKLLALKISDNVAIKEEEPEFFYTSTMHGDEVTGYVLMLRLIDYLLTNFDSDTRVTDLINNTEIWINPLSNPDGTFFGGDADVSGATRGNSEIIDLNRNFPDPKEGEHPDGNAWQPENISMMNFLISHNFVLAANFHGGVEVINYPWDSWTSSVKTHADDAFYQEISREYADTVHANSYGYMTFLNNGITNGGDWYVVSGGRQDYMNYYLHSREVTIEISSLKMPDASTLPNYWNYNYRSFLNYINRVHTGIFGKVTDQDGNPLRAKITLAYHDADSSEIYSDAVNGMYYRMIGDGSYHMIAALEGYSQEEFDIIVPAGSSIEQNIVLQKFPQGIEYLQNSFARVTNLINPFSNCIDFNLELTQPARVDVRLIGIGGKQMNRMQINGQRGNNQILIDTNGLEDGIYICKLESQLFNLQFKIVKHRN